MRSAQDLLLPLCLLAACGDPVGVDATATDVTDTTATVGTTESSAADDGSATGVADTTAAPDETTATDSSTGGEVTSTTGGMTSDGATTETGSTSGCSKVDFLVVVDNSGSMGDEQKSLQAAFPSFVESVVQAPGGPDDVHILVTDVDAYVFEQCDDGCACAEGEGCPATTIECQLGCAVNSLCTIDGSFVCGETTPLPCESVLGAGVTYPRGTGASNQDCEFSSGARYIDASEPDVGAAFSCAAGVGTGSFSSTERPMQAMVSALAPVGEVAECNAGWLRDDAVLVVVFITDESDDEKDSAGDPETWREALLLAKGGDASAVVVLGLFGDNDLPGAICTDLMDELGAEAAPRLREFVDSWGAQGLAGSVCAESYSDFFNDAAMAIDASCASFVPPAD